MSFFDDFAIYMYHVLFLHDNYINLSLCISFNATRACQFVADKDGDHYQ